MWLLLVALIVFIVVVGLIMYANNMANGKCAPMPSMQNCNRCRMPKPRCRCQPKKCEFC